ncbi:MAG: TetR/AcrR family transcriptional regulator [Saprospiraceae bacterium]
MDTKQEILQMTESLFMRYGIKSVTMDDIARELGISKKTLYQFVDNKQDLIEQSFQKHIEEELLIIQHIQKDAKDSIDEMLKIARYVIKMVKKVSPTVMYDLEKYYRKTFMQMKELHSRHIFNYILDNINRGIEKGIYRKDIKPELIAKIYVTNTSHNFGSELFPMTNDEIQALIREYAIYHIHGIATSLGLECLNEYIDTNLNNID